MISFYYVNQVTKEHVRGDRNPPVGVWNRVQADADGWIEWRGDGECPLQDGCPVDVKHRGGFVNYGAYASSDPTEDGIISIKMDGDVARTKATKWRWKGSLGDIVAYRPIIDADTKPEPPAWDGEGLPPVGCECEVSHDDKWMECEILAHYRPCNGGPFVAVYAYGIDEGRAVGQKIKGRFRPIRSEEDRSIDAMIAAAGLDDEGYNRAVCRDLFRAGYRKTGG